MIDEIVRRMAYIGAMGLIGPQARRCSMTFSAFTLLKQRGSADLQGGRNRYLKRDPFVGRAKGTRVDNKPKNKTPFAS